jgi:predicted TIM-barrel fold metal-dependent hydrolase
MSPHIDAHIHFFLPGYVGILPENCRRQSPDEITLYQGYAQTHEIEQALVVGYEGDRWAEGNNAYIATLASQHAWVRPVAFVSDPVALSLSQLKTWQQQRFVGISLYLFTPEMTGALARVPGEIWEWLADHAWLISVNSTGEQWTGWQPILQAHPQLRLLISHLGLPPAVTDAPSLEDARATLQSVLQLARFPHTYVKFSGFYALAQPGHAYPHNPCWPYAQMISETFGTARILWASDFSPALEYVSFPQTIDVVSQMHWLSHDDLDAVYYTNMARLLAALDERNPTP